MKTDYPGDVCELRRDSDTPTAFQLACGIINVNYAHEQHQLVSLPQFNNGWAVGTEGELGDWAVGTEGDPGDFMFPTLENTPGTLSQVYDAQRAFILGVTTGLIAKQKGYRSAFCIMPEHNGECETYKAANEDVSSASTHRDPYPAAWIETDDGPRNPLI